MRLQKTLWKILIPIVVLGTTVVVIAQVRGGKSLFQKQEDLVTEFEDETQLTEDDPWGELKRIYQSFNDSQQFFYSGKILLHAGDEDRLLEETSYTCETINGNYTYSIDSVDMIYNNGLSLVVYHRDKLMMIGKEKPFITNWWSVSNIDSLEKYSRREGAEVSVLKSGTEKIISVENTGNPDIYGYELHYNPNTYRINKLVLLMTSVKSFEDETSNETGSIVEEEVSTDTTTSSVSNLLNLYELEIRFDQFIKRNPGSHFHPEGKYLDIQNNAIKVKDAYKDYQVVSTNGIESFKNR